MEAAVAVADDPPMNCPECGLATPLSSTHGLCPRCLLGLAVEPEEVPRAALGSRLGGLPDFTLVREIGTGGSGVVYEAIQESTRQTVALKLLRRASPDAEERFRVEAQTAATLAHPNILPVFEVGEADDGLFYVMKFALRGSLAANLNLLRAKSPDAAWCRSTARLLAQLAHALQHAHERGVIHRDLKPSNILLDADGTPYLADFGLARSLKEDARLTLTDAIIGTPHYMAPEQAAGNRAAQTTATDLYSFGAVLYALLTGQPPFPGDNVWEVIRRVRENTPASPLAHLSENDRTLPRAAALTDLETLCLKCLEKEPSRRPAAAAELAAELERIANGQRIKARPITRAERFARWCEREPLVVSLSGALGLTLVVALALAVAHGRKMSALARVEAEQLARAEADNRALRRTLSHTLLAEAEKNLGQQQFAEGAAAVAALLRHDPQHPVAGSWAKHFAHLATSQTPGAPLAPLGPPQLRAALDADRWLVQEGPRHLRVWSAARGGPEPEPVFTAPSDLVSQHADAAAQCVVFACADGSVWQWAPASATPPQAFAQFPNPVPLVRVSPDGQRVLLAGTNGFVRAWQLDPPQKLWSTRWHSEALLDADWDTRGNLLVSSGADGRVALWHVTNGLAFGPDLKFTNVPSVAFVPHRPWFALAAQDRSGLRVRSLAEGYPLVPAPLPMATPIERIEFITTNRCLTVSADRVWLSILNHNPGGPKWGGRKELVRATGTQPRCSPDGTLLTVPQPNGSLSLYDTRTLEAAAAPLRTDAPIVEAQFTRDNRSLLVRRADGRLQFLPFGHSGWSDHTLPVGNPDQFDFLLGGRGLLTREGHTLTLWPLPEVGRVVPHPPSAPHLTSTHVRAHAISPSGELLALGDSNSVRILRVTPSAGQLTATPVGAAASLAAPPRQLHFTPDDAQLLVLSSNAPARVLATATGRELAAWPAPADSALVAVPDAESVLVATPAGHLHRRALSDGRTLAQARFTYTNAALAHLTLSPDRTQVALADQAGRMQVFTLPTLTPVGPASAHGTTLATLRFTPDGQQLYSAGHDSTVRFWDWRTGKMVGQPFTAANPHPSLRTVDATVWAGRPWLIMSTLNKRIRFWDTTTRARLLPDFYSTRDLPPALVSPDGQWFLFVENGRVQLLAAERFTNATPPWFPDFLEDLHGCQRLADGTLARRPPLTPAQLRVRYPLTDPAHAASLPKHLQNLRP